MTKSVEEQFNEIVQEYAKEIIGDIEEGLTLASIELRTALEQHSPVSEFDKEGQKHFKESWVIKDQYKGVRYIGNTKTVKGKSSKEMPLSNILEYAESSPHKGFIQRTFNSMSDRLHQKMISKIKK